jgi:hypothetical protein
MPTESETDRQKTVQTDKTQTLDRQIDRQRDRQTDTLASRYYFFGRTHIQTDSLTRR